MGILNVTPDSFSDGGLYLKPDKAIRHAEQMAAEGAELIDVGAESTRPGAQAVSLEEELRRVIPVIRVLRRRLAVLISIDTTKAEVARRAIEAGASMVNDVTALRGDPKMPEVIARAGVPVILMHMQGTPQTMQRAPRYRDVVGEVSAFLAEAIQRAEQAGIAPDNILLDPGLGFGKTVTHNLLLLKHLDELLSLGRPIVIGPSRKSFIGKVLDVQIGERVPGTLACIASAMEQGVAIVRVHDVKPTVQFVSMWEAIHHASRSQRRSRRDRAAGPVGAGARAG